MSQSDVKGNAATSGGKQPEGENVKCLHEIINLGLVF